MFKIKSDTEIQVDGKAFRIEDFVRLIVRTDSRFCKNMTGVLAAVRIDAKPSDIETADMALLREACAEPSSGAYPIQPAISVAPFLVAIRDAKETV